MPNIRRRLRLARRWQMTSLPLVQDRTADAESAGPALLLDPELCADGAAESAAKRIRRPTACPQASVGPLAREPKSLARRGCAPARRRTRTGSSDGPSLRRVAARDSGHPPAAFGADEGDLAPPPSPHSPRASRQPRP